MAVTFTGGKLPQNITVQTSATPDVVTEVEVPIGARNVFVLFKGAAGVWSLDQTLVDAVSIIAENDSNAFFQGSNVGFNIDFREGEHGGATEISSLFVASNTASTYVQIIVSG